MTPENEPEIKEELPESDQDVENNIDNDTKKGDEAQCKF